MANNNGNVHKLNADLKAFAKLLDVNLATVVKKVTVEAHTGVVNATPVDTGRARASWALGIGATSEFVPADISAAAKAARAKAQSAGASASPVHDAATISPGDLSAIDGKQKVFITSNLEYMEALENGHSQQAPAGMVRVTLAGLEVSIDQAVEAAKAGK